MNDERRRWQIAEPRDLRCLQPVATYFRNPQKRSTSFRFPRLSKQSPPKLPLNSFVNLAKSTCSSIRHGARYLPLVRTKTPLIRWPLHPKQRNRKHALGLPARRGRSCAQRQRGLRRDLVQEARDAQARPVRKTVRFFVEN
jgi:hypothetical protein